MSATFSILHDRCPGCGCFAKTVEFGRRVTFHCGSRASETVSVFEQSGRCRRICENLDEDGLRARQRRELMNGPDEVLVRDREGLLTFP